MSKQQALVVGVQDESGWAVVRELTKAGYAVSVLTDAQEAQCAPSGEDAYIGFTDTGNVQRMQSDLDVAARRLSNLRVLVNLADHPVHRSFIECTPEQFDKTIEQNFGYITRTVRALGRVMARAGGGSVINVTSEAALHPRGEDAMYAAAAGAVGAFTRVAALDAGEDGLRFHCLLVRDRSVHAQALAHAVRALADDLTGYMTGETVHLDTFFSREVV